MRYFEIVVLSALVASTAARPALHSTPSSRLHARDMKLSRREVPQEQSHKRFLTKTQEMLILNNPNQIVDAVFGLLGNAAAVQGIGSIADADCLQQATADQAFTNAVAAGDVDGQVAALVYRTLERNTGQVGLKSVDCTAIQAVNPQIAALSQHQDPASDGAAAANKAIVLELAVQISSVGGDPLEAINSGTFAPGQIGDPTAAGNTCDVADDAEGCIFTQGLLVPDASQEEIQAAVQAGGAADAGQAQVDANATCAANVTANATVVADANVTAVADANAIAIANATATANATADGQVQADAGAKAQAEGDAGAAQANVDAAAEADKAAAKAEVLKQKNKGYDNEDDNKDNKKDYNKDDKNKDDGDRDNKKDKLDDNDYRREIDRQQNFDVIIVVQLAAQNILQFQANAWHVIALAQQNLQQQLLQQLITVQSFQQQLFIFQQQTVSIFVLAVEQHISIVEQNQNVLSLGGFDAIKVEFQQQIGDLSDIEKLLNVGQIGHGDAGLAKLLS